jgi:hypothetical protein
MKRLLTLLFTFAVAFSLAMPVFAQEATGQEAAPKVEKKVEKKKKAPKEKKKKKGPKTEEAAPPTPPK